MKKVSDEIIDLAGIEHRNVEKYMKRLSGELPALDLLMHTIGTIFPMIQKALLKKDGELRYVVIANLYSLMGQDLLKGAVNFTKGYVTDASFQSRRILEAAALAIEMYRKPRKVKYYTTFETEADREKYIENFKVFLIIQNTLSEDTQKDYARLCFSVHPSALAIGDRAAMNEKFEHSIKFIEYSDEASTSSLRMHFLIYLVTVFHGFRDLATALKDDPNFSWDKVEPLLTAFDTSWKEQCHKLYIAHPELLSDLVQD